MKTNHDGTITLLPENVWTACGACGQRVTADSIHTCSPQTKPLSDEEIEQIFFKLVDRNPWEHRDENFYTEFAKAIEERHGIK